MTIFEINIFGFNFAPSYYGLMYAIGFLVGFYIIKKRGKIQPLKILDDLFLYIFLGVVLGGRLGYVLFYNLNSYISEPLNILKVWEGGMSFHGGVIGVLLAMFLFSRKYKVSFLKIADQVTLVLPIGLGLGRIGNYLNKELLGYAGYEGKFAVYVNGTGYFPSPLIEAFLEGLVLFIILNAVYYVNKLVTKRSIKYGFDGQIAALFLIIYAVFRLFVEILFRTPDAHIGYIYGYFTMGELLTLPMLIIGFIIYRRLGLKKYIEIIKADNLLKPSREEINEIDNYLLLQIQKINKSGITISTDDFNSIIESSINMADNINSNFIPLIELLSKRFEVVRNVGEIKKTHKISPYQSDRWNNVLKRISQKSNKLGLDEKMSITFWNMIHDKALELENKIIK